MNLKNLSTRTKLILCFSVIVFSNVAFGFHDLYSISDIHGKVVFSEEWAEVVFRLNEASRQATVVRRYDLNYLLKLDPADDVLRGREDLCRSVENHLNEYKSDVLALKHDMRGQKRRALDLIDAVIARWNGYRVLSDKIVELCASDEFQKAREIAGGDAFTAFHAFEDAVEALVEFNREGPEYAKDVSEKVYASALRMTAVTLLAVSAFSVIVTILLSSGIRRAVDELLRVSKAVGEGDFNVSATVFAHDDLGILSAQYNDTIAKIRDLVAETEKHRKEAEDATAAKSRFLASMSHEIRTPMNVIVGMSELIRTDNLDEKQKSYFKDIKAMSDTLLQIINDILDSSKIEAGKMDIVPTNFKLRKMVNSVCSMGQYLATSKNLEFTHEIDDGVPDVFFGDEVRIRQILTNIVNNAVKYTLEGWVSVRVKQDEREGSQGVLFTIADSGIGIKEEDMPSLFKAFERFDTVKNHAVGGTGLGLSITKKLVDMMAGTIAVESEYGNGSVFSVFLPLAEGDPDKAAQAEVPPIMAEDAKVLVADDNSINLLVAREYLMRHGIESDTAVDGEEALKMVQEKSYDLVFMDHMMPVMDGLESITRIRALGGVYADLPIIVLSANVISEAVKSFFDVGANDFLPKPIEGNKLNELLARWLPPEKTRVGEVSESEDVPTTDDDGFLQEMSEIGLDTAKGLFHTNSKEAYLRILRQVSDELPGTVEVILSFLSEGNLHEYSIRVHAMKSVFATIGSEDISKAAYKLEMASKAGDEATCQAETEALCEAMLSFREKFLNTSFAAAESVEKEKVSADDLRRHLEVLEEACLFGKVGEIDAMTETLKRASLNEDVDAQLEEILRLLKSYDYETAAGQIEELLKGLSNFQEAGS